MCIYVQNMKFLSSNLRTGGLSTDNDANDANNDTWWTIHDCIGSLAWLPNEPTSIPCHLRWLLTFQPTHFITWDRSCDRPKWHPLPMVLASFRWFPLLLVLDKPPTGKPALVHVPLDISALPSTMSFDFWPNQSCDQPKWRAMVLATVFHGSLFYCMKMKIR